MFRSQSHLSASHSPEKPVGREQEVQRIANALQPLTRRKKPENLLVHGPAGIGKTTCIRYVLRKLENETRLKTVFINCWQYNTRPSLLTELLIKLGYPAPRKGKPVDELLSKLQEWLDKNRGFALALDEFDQLGQRTEVIYDLQRLNEEAENNLGLIMVSNKQPSTLQLDPRSESRLNCQTLEFQPYSRGQLIQILEKRVERAFQPSSVQTEVIERVAEEVARSGGDCREAFERLLQAGRKAEREGAHELTLQFLEETGG